MKNKLIGLIFCFMILLTSCSKKTSNAESTVAKNEDIFQELTDFGREYWGLDDSKIDIQIKKIDSIKDYDPYTMKIEQVKYEDRNVYQIYYIEVYAETYGTEDRVASVYSRINLLIVEKKENIEVLYYGKRDLSK